MAASFFVSATSQFRLEDRLQHSLRVCFTWGSVTYGAVSRWIEDFLGYRDESLSAEQTNDLILLFHVCRIELEANLLELPIDLLPTCWRRKHFTPRAALAGREDWLA